MFKALETNDKDYTTLHGSYIIVLMTFNFSPFLVYLLSCVKVNESTQFFFFWTLKARKVLFRWLKKKTLTRLRFQLRKDRSTWSEQIKKKNFPFFSFFFDKRLLLVSRTLMVGGNSRSGSFRVSIPTHLCVENVR